MNKNITAVIAAGLMLLSAGCGSQHATLERPTAAATSSASVVDTGIDLGAVWDSLAEPCVSGASSWIVTVPPSGPADQYWPDESAVRARVAAVHTESTDLNQVTEAVRAIRLDLLLLYRELRADSDTLANNPSATTLIDDMKDNSNDFEEDLKAHLAGLSSGQLPVPEIGIYEKSASTVCQTR